VAAHPTHPLAAAKRVRLTALAGERLIAYSRADYPEYHDWLMALFKPAVAVPLIGEEHDSATSLIASVEAGRGVAIVPAVLACLAGPRLTLRPLAEKPDPFVVGVARCAGKPSDLVERFVRAARG
jgi:DNA-binding transcriptional LysR family regulator